MKINECLLKYVNRDSKPRVLGRYWASDVSSILKGYLTPETFFEKSKIDLSGTRMILVGQAMEDKLRDVFEQTGVKCETQVKKEIQIDDFTLVVKPDFIFKDFVIETKFPFSIVRGDKIPQRYLHQLECEYRAFFKQVYLGVLGIPFNLKLIEYTPSKRRWSNICKTLREFHSKLINMEFDEKVINRQFGVSDKVFKAQEKINKKSIIKVNSK